MRLRPGGDFAQVDPGRGPARLNGHYHFVQKLARMMKNRGLPQCVRLKLSGGGMNRHAALIRNLAPLGIAASFFLVVNIPRM